MKRNRRLHLGWLVGLWLFVVDAHAQHREVTLDEAEVIAAHDTDAAFTEYPDSLLMRALPATSLGDLLQLSSALNLRNYGPPGGLVSATGRGLPSDHLAVFWMGVPLNSPSLGMVDLGAIPTALFGAPRLQFGHHTSRSQMGGAAGVIHLSRNNEAGHAIGSGYDDLNNLRHWARVVFHPAEGLKLSTRYQRERAQNSFEYNDPYLFGNPERTQKNNAYQRDALIQELSYLNDRWRIDAGIWLQHAALDIPDIMGKIGEAHAHQRDSSIRAVAAITRYTQHGKFNLRIARFSEHLHYTYRMNENAPIAIDSRVSTHRNFAQAGWSGRFGDWHIEGFADASIEEARSSNHGSEGAQRVLLGAQSRVGYHLQKWQFNAGLRYDSGPGAALPVPEIDIARDSKLGLLKLGARRIFRYPDLNQLYWRPGGDPNLEPELGEVIDFSLNKIILMSSISVGYTTSIYYQNMQSMILWVNEGTGLQARNLRSVTSQGALARIDLDLPAGRMNVKQTLQVNLQRNEGLGEFDQRFFPQTQGRYALSVVRNQVMVGCAARYVSESWLPENLNAVRGRQDATLLFDAYASIDLTVKSTLLRISTMLRNIGNVMDYRVTQVATPGRVLSLNVEWNF